MLRHQSQIIGYAIHANDGVVGKIIDVLFDDSSWLIRWFVVDTGTWLPGRKVLLPPSALASVNHIGHQFSVRLDRQQVKACPDVDTDRPVSRQHETDIYSHYGWVPYWGAGSYMGMVGYGGFMNESVMAPAFLPLMARNKGIDEAQRAKDDPALRGIGEVTGYLVRAKDGDVGQIEDFLVGDDDWNIHYLVVNVGSWWHGNKVLVSPMAVQSIHWADRLVTLGADRQTIKDSAAYDPSATVDPIYEKQLHKYSDDLRLREGVDA
jgi:hypothetical protein